MAEQSIASLQVIRTSKPSIRQRRLALKCFACCRPNSSILDGSWNWNNSPCRPNQAAVWLCIWDRPDISRRYAELPTCWICDSRHSITYLRSSEISECGHCPAELLSASLDKSMSAIMCKWKKKQLLNITSMIFSRRSHNNAGCRWYQSNCRILECTASSPKIFVHSTSLPFQSSLKLMPGSFYYISKQLSCQQCQWCRKIAAGDKLQIMSKVKGKLKDGE